MRLLICICFAAAAWQLHAQGEIGAPTGSYAGDLPHRANAKVVFRASIGDFTTGPLKMRLVGQDVATQDDIITLLVPAQRRSRVIKATLPFGGRYVGRHDMGRNVIVGRFSGFAQRGRPNIPQQRFELAHVNTNVAAVANPPVN